MWNWITKLDELRAEGKPVTAVTVTQVTGSTPREPGAKMLVLSDGTFFGTIGGGRLEQMAITDAMAALKAGKSKVIRYPLGAKTGQCCGGVAELFFEILNDGPQLVVFGAGHVARAICRTMTGTAFQTRVIDEREEWVFSKAIPRAVTRLHGEWRDFADDLPWNSEKTYVLVMTHRHDTDQAIIEYAVQRPAKFIGLIGSQSKWARFRQRLIFRGVDEKLLARVRCPVGLSLGGKAPQEIAVSIAGELLEEFYGKNGLVSAHPSRRGTKLPSYEPERSL